MLTKYKLCNYPIKYMNDETSGILTGDLILIAAGTGCHNKGTEIIMADGTFKRVENITVGDCIMGNDGLPRRVLNLVRGKDEFYKIRPVKGESFLVNKDHILHLYNSKKHTTIDISVCDYLNLSATMKHFLKLLRCSGIDNFVRHTNNPIDPYFLGVLLGDGSFMSSVSVCTPDSEIIAELERIAKTYGVKLTKYSKKDEPAYDFKFYAHRGCQNPIIEDLRGLGLYKKKCEQKFIPDDYKYGDRDTRQKLLAGLLDTDGFRSQNGCYEIITKGKRLAEDILFVARSLGLAAYQSTKFVKKYGNYNRINISGDCSAIPCKVKRKQSQPRKQVKSVLVTGFTVEKANRQQFFGFQIDDNNLYLTSDFTIHHNCGKSTTSRLLTQNAIYEHCPVVLYSLEDEVGTFASDSIYREYGLSTGEYPNFRDFLLDATANPEKYKTYREAAARKNARTNKDGLRLLQIHEMSSELLSGNILKKVIAQMEQEIEQGYRLFILDHLDVLVPTEKPQDMVAAITELWRLVSTKQIALITFSQLSSQRNTEVLCPGLKDIRGSASKQQTPTIIFSLARDSICDYTGQYVGSPTFCRMLKNRQGKKPSMATIFFYQGHYTQDYIPMDTNESGTVVNGVSVKEFIRHKSAVKDLKTNPPKIGY